MWHGYQADPPRGEAFRNPRISLQQGNASPKPPPSPIPRIPHHKQESAMTRIRRSSSNTLAADAAPPRDTSSDHSPPDSPPSHTRPDTKQGQLRTLSHRNPGARNTDKARHPDAFPATVLPSDSAGKQCTDSDQPQRPYDIDELAKQLSILASLAGRRVAEIGMRAALGFAEMEQLDQRKPPPEGRGDDEIVDGLKRDIPTKFSK